MSEEKHGIQETKDLLIALAGIGNAIGTALADDGKITLGDLPKLGPVVFKLPAAVGGIHKIGGELADLDAQERLELAEAFADELNLPQENAEALVEDLIALAVHTYETISKHFIK